MNKIAIIYSILLVYIVYIPLDAAAGNYALSTASSPCTSNASQHDPISPRKPSPRVLESVDESALRQYKKKLTPAESERLRDANQRVDQIEISDIDINYLINIDTDNYLFDPIASYRLRYIEHKLCQSLKQKDPSYRDRYSVVQTLTLEDLTLLVDHAAEGTLPDRIFPYSYLQFMYVRDKKKDVDPNNLDPRSYSIIAILVAAANRNLRENPAYNMIRNHARQNQFLTESNDFLDAYYAELNKPRKGIEPVSPKKKRGSSLLQGISKRFSRHKRSASAAQP